MSPKSKRPPRATLEQKIMVLDYFHRSQRTQANTVEHFREQMAISTSSISEWLKEESSLREMYNTASGQFRQAKRKLKFKYEQINNEMDKMVRTRQKEGLEITEPVLREHWRLYAARFGVGDPKRLNGYSHGWLAQFKKRHGLDHKARRDRINEESLEETEIPDDDEDVHVEDPIDDDMVGGPSEAQTNDLVQQTELASQEQGSSSSVMLPGRHDTLQPHHHLQQSSMAQLQSNTRPNTGIHSDLNSQQNQQPSSSSSNTTNNNNNNNNNNNTTSSAPAPPPPFLEEYNEDYMQSLQGYESLMSSQSGFLTPQFRPQPQPLHNTQLQQPLVSYGQQRPQRSHQAQQQQQQAHVQAHAHAQAQAHAHQQHQAQQAQQVAQAQVRAQAQVEANQEPSQTMIQRQSTLSESDVEFFLTKYAEEFFTIHQNEYPESHKLFFQFNDMFRREKEVYGDKRLKELLYKR